MKFLNKLRSLGENDRIVYKNVAGAFLVKGFALFVTLYTLPSYISFFNDSELLGLWFTILSLLNWILNFDLGIGNGLRNHLSTSLASGTPEESKRYISSAYFSVGVIVLLLSAIFPFVIKGADFNNLLNIDASIVSLEALYYSIVIVFIGVMLQFWLKLINSVLYALQLSSLNNLLVLCTNILILAYVKLAPSSDNDTNIIVMAVVHAVAVIIPLLWATWYVFRKRLKFSRPSFKYVTVMHTKKVLSLGGIFFFVQIAYMVIMSTNEFLITKTTSNSDVIDYQAYYKLFSLGSTIFALTLTPIWSVITKAKAENNILWIENTYRRFTGFALLFIVCEFVLILFTKPIIHIWLGEETLSHIDIRTCVIFAVFASTMIYVSLLSSIANGLGKLKTQSICYGIGAILKVPLSVFLVSYLASWEGVIIANIICMLIYCICEPIVLRKYFSQKVQ